MPCNAKCNSFRAIQNSVLVFDSQPQPPRGLFFVLFVQVLSFIGCVTSLKLLLLAGRELAFRSKSDFPFEICKA